MDLQMPEMNGLDAIISIRGEFPEAKIIVLTTYKGDVQILRALKAGARGYLLKNTFHKELLDTIRAVHAEKKALSPEAWGLSRFCGQPTLPHVHVRRTWMTASAKLTSCHCSPRHSEIRRPVPAAKSVRVRSGSRRLSNTAYACSGVRIIASYSLVVPAIVVGRRITNRMSPTTRADTNREPYRVCDVVDDIVRSGRIAAYPAGT